MYRTEKSEKAKQLKPKIKTVVFTTFWLMLAAAAMLFIAFFGHI
jgi:Trk-type K+ transport system membrane component